MMPQHPPTPSRNGPVDVVGLALVVAIILTTLTLWESCR